MIEQGNLYFVQEGLEGPIKIGFTVMKPEQRMRQFQTGNSSPLRLLGAVWTRPLEERRWHQQFRACHKHNEWFYPSEALVKAIEAAIAEPPVDLLTVPYREPLADPCGVLRQWMADSGVGWDELAKRSGYGRDHLKYMVRSGGRQIIPRLAMALEEACGGAVTAYDFMANSRRYGQERCGSETFPVEAA